MQDFNKLVSLLKDKTVYIQTHNFPDPDAIASAFGLQQLLKHFDINSTLCYEGKIDKLSATKMLDAFDISMFAYSEICDKMKEEDAIICVDSQKNGGNITDFIGDEIAAIDHHPTFVKIAYQYSDIRIIMRLRKVFVKQTSIIVKTIVIIIICLNIYILFKGIYHFLRNFIIT